MTTADRVRDAREAAGLSQRKLAPLCGVERTTIGKLEAGTLAPSVELVRTIAAVLGADLGQPHRCRCGRCDELTFAEYVQGHNPKRQGPYKGRYRREGHRRHLVRSRPGDRLRCARIERGWTLRQLAARVDVTLYTLSSIENGHDLPSAELARRLEEALESEDLFELRPCPCSDECDVLTVGGRFARGHHPHTTETAALCGQRITEWWTSDESEAWRSKLSDIWEEHWANGGRPVRELFEAARAGRTPVPIKPETRQRYGQQWGGHTPAKADRPRGAPRKYDLKDEDGNVIRARSTNDVLAEVREVCTANPKLGLRPVADRANLTKAQLEYLLDDAGCSLSALRQPVS